MTDNDIQRQRREVLQLRQRVAELESDIVHLNGQITRLQKQGAHFTARRMPPLPKPMPDTRSIGIVDPAA